MNSSSNNLAAVAALRSPGNMPSREGRMESLIRSLSSGNVGNGLSNSGGSNATFNNLLQSMQNSFNGDGNSKNGSSNNIFGSGKCK